MEYPKRFVVDVPVVPVDVGLSKANQEPGEAISVEPLAQGLFPLFVFVPVKKDKETNKRKACQRPTDQNYENYAKRGRRESDAPRCFCLMLKFILDIEQENYTSHIAGDAKLRHLGVPDCGWGCARMSLDLPTLLPSAQSRGYWK